MPVAERKRRRPQLFGRATVATWALICLSPSAAVLFLDNQSWGEQARNLRPLITPRTPEKPMTVFIQDRPNVRNVQSRGRRRLQLDFTVEDTPAPTFFPLEQPTPLTAAPQPSPSPSLAPLIGHTMPASFPPSQTSYGNRENDQSMVVHIPDTDSLTNDPMPNPPLLNFAAVTVGFDVLLETDSQQDLIEMAQQAKIILEDHLTERFREGFADVEGVVLRSVDLKVRSFLTPPSSRRVRVLAEMERLLELSRAITLETRGVAGFQVNRNAVDAEEFLNKVNTIMDESLGPEQLMDLFQNSTSGLSDYRVARVTNTETPDTKSKPTLAEMIIAFILIFLMLLSLGAYAYIFYRKRQKRLKRRKQFGVGNKSPSTYKGPSKPRPHGASITPAAVSMAASPSGPPAYPGVVNAVSSESSYKGLGSESEEDDADIFAKELRLAASLDRRAWNDFQHQTEQGSSVVGKAMGRNDPSFNPPIDVYRELANIEPASEGIEMDMNRIGYRSQSNELSSLPGGVGLTVIGDTVSLQSNNSFPYGDEPDAEDYKQSVYGGGRGLSQDSGRNNMAIQKGSGELERNDSSGGWRMTPAASSELKNDETKEKQVNPRPFSFLYHGTESKLEPDTHSTNYAVTIEDENGDNSHPAENASDPTTTGGYRGSPMSYSWSTNPRGGSSTENGTTAAVRGSPQGSPHSSSWNTASRVVSQDGTPSASPAFESTGAVNEENSSVGDSNADSSLVTADIVKEVQRLSHFVKTYERKKQSRMRREKEDGDDFDVSNSVASSMDYDSLIETVSSLRNVVEPVNKSYSENDIARKVTSSTQSLTPNQSFSNSPERAMARQFDGIESMQSSDSSDIETTESDFSRRLGITPFSVQKPVSYQNPTLQNPQVHAISHITTAYYQRTSSPRSPSENVSLKDLRHSGGNMLDGFKQAPSDEFSDVRKKQNTERPFNTKPLRDPRTITARSASSKLSSVISKFETKIEAHGRGAVYPPNEHWQYEH